MEVLLGITGHEFTIIASSKAAMRGATILKATDDKTRNLTDHCVMAFSGEAGDTVQFAEYIQANLALYTMRNSHTLQPPAVASFTRTELARALRSRNPYNVNLLLGGVTTPPQPSPFNTTDTSSAATATSKPAEGQKPSDQTVAQESLQGNYQTVDKPTPKLYWIDYLASCAEVPYAAHGYAQYYCLSILDKHHHPDMSLEQGLKVLRMCSDELRRRLPIDFKGLNVKIVTPEGVKVEEFADDHKVTAA